MPSESLTYKLFGVDVNASHAIKGVGDAAHHSELNLARMATQTAKWGSVAAAASISAVGLAGSLGVGLAGAVAVGAAAIAAQVPRVRSAFVELGKGVKDQLIGLSGPVQDALINVVNHVLIVFNQLQPTFKAIFKAVAPVVEQLGTGLVDALAVLLRALPALLTVVQPLVNVFTAALVPIMGSLVQTLKNILGPTAQNAKAFGDLLTAVASLLPVLGTLLGVVVRIGGFLIEHFKPVLVPLAGLILGIVAAVKIWAVATKTFAIAQTALNVVLAANPIGLVILAIAALIAIVVVIATKTRWFQNIWNASWGFIKRIVMDVWDWIKGHWPLLLAVLTGPIGAAAIFIIRNWGNIKQAASDAFTTIITWFKSLPGRITGALGDLGRLLFQKGKDVIQGLWNGLVNIWNKVKDWIGGLGGWIKAHKGPEALDRNLLFNAGHLIMDGFFRGLKAGGLKAFGFVKSVAGNIAAGFRGSNLTEWVNAAMGITGVPANWFAPLMRRVMFESGGNPNAINLTDINAQRGHPSQGLMQTIPSTFAAYALPGLGGILNPVANLVAAIRYILARYGTIFAIDPPVRGYDAGGYLPPGLSLAYNGTGRPEPVGGGVSITVQVGQVIGSDLRKASADLLQGIREDLRRRGKAATANLL